VEITNRSRSHVEAHKTSVEYTVADVVQVLQEHLGQRLTAHVAGVEDVKAVKEWASGNRTPREGAERRLRATLQIFLLLQSEENAHTARAWLIGMNPQLGDETPADAIRAGNFRDVLAAAKAYITGG
jgi:hypothetical protein